MGNSKSSSWILPEHSVSTFREAVHWARLNQFDTMDDAEIEKYIQEKIASLSLPPDSTDSMSNSSSGSPCPYSVLASYRDMKSPRPPTASIKSPPDLSPVAAFAVSGRMTVEASKEAISKASVFMDSSYHESWLPAVDADRIFDYLYEEGKHMRTQMKAMQATTDVKYPLSTLTYGAKRAVDGALALDRWGSYHESWCRVQEPTEEISKLCDTVRAQFQLPPEALNSVVVNFYWDGASTYIPAHRDTVACLEENSSIYCLSLGATREFALCSCSDSGRFLKKDLRIANLWSVAHGDLFALGPQTNRSFCHAVPQDPTVQALRISIIFRTVTKSFIDLGPNVCSRSVMYANGVVKSFRAECILSSSLSDVGTRVHVCDLIHQREEKKKVRLSVAAAAPTEGGGIRKTRLPDCEDQTKYFSGQGAQVPIIDTASAMATDTIAPEPTEYEPQTDEVDIPQVAFSDQRFDSETSVASHRVARSRRRSIVDSEALNSNTRGRTIGHSKLRVMFAGASAASGDGSKYALNRSRPSAPEPGTMKPPEKCVQTAFEVKIGPPNDEDEREGPAMLRWLHASHRIIQ